MSQKQLSSSTGSGRRSRSNSILLCLPAASADANPAHHPTAGLVLSPSPSQALLDISPHRIQLEDYLVYLTQHTVQPEEGKQVVNVSLSAGGMAAVYMAGIVGYLVELIVQQKLVLNHIYTASAGAITALFVMQALHYRHHEKYHMSLDTILHYVNEDVRDLNAKGLGIAEAYRVVLRAVAPPDLYQLCSGRVFISFHVWTCFGGIQRFTISHFHSNEHLFTCAVASATVPFISINAFFTLYQCPSCQQSYYAMDGLYTDIVDEEHPTICVDLGQLDFPVVQRMFLTDKHCEVWALRGIYELNYLLNYNVDCKSLYYYKKSVLQRLITFCKQRGTAWYRYWKAHPMNLFRIFM